MREWPPAGCASSRTRGWACRDRCGWRASRRWRRVRPWSHSLRDTVETKGVVEEHALDGVPVEGVGLEQLLGRARERAVAVGIVGREHDGLGEQVEHGAEA